MRAVLTKGAGQAQTSVDSGETENKLPLNLPRGWVFGVSISDQAAVAVLFLPVARMHTPFSLPWKSETRWGGEGEGEGGGGVEQGAG